MLRRYDDSALRVTLDFEVNGKRQDDQKTPGSKWETKNVGLKSEDVLKQKSEIDCEELQK